ncbi:hypothetical protein Pan216_28620 [Planctomycetes bacterium Pan216]|uniref:DUF2254 domain-containing protein n=1 Tax=Kolteria novifilia TaxID=2527975 RepID=A0A518B4X4_9BACT|nr:hypothetical protein Pan216_28620 [Planctomycetes bacterium Pan216]
MREWIEKAWGDLQESLWFVPGVLSLTALFLGILLPAIELNWGGSQFGMLGRLPQDPAAVRVCLATLVTAMVSVAGIVFSITIATLSIASSQFGSRLLRSFMSDRRTQFALGIFPATSLYCLLVHLSIREIDDEVFTGPLSLAVALLLVIVCLAMLIIHTHHLAISIQAPSVIRSVTRDLENAIDRLFPDEAAPEGTGSAGTSVELPREQYAHKVTSDKAGYVQAILTEELVARATQRKLIIDVLIRPGAFVTENETLAHVWIEEDDDKGIAAFVNRCVLVGTRRTPHQDMECAIDELVEVAVRALSPGINDPFTAIVCIDWLGSTLKQLARRRFPSRHFLDGEKTPRLTIPSNDFPSIIEAGCNQIRQHARGNIAVSIRLIEALGQVHREHLDDRSRSALREQAEMVLAGCKMETCHENDINDLQSRFDKLFGDAGSA